MEKSTRINKKGSKNISGHANRSKTRPNILKRHSFENETEATSSSTKKLKSSNVEVPVNAMHGYRIINFISLFFGLREMLKCKQCNGNVTFTESSVCGLGFKLVINCENCVPRYINSSPLISNAYEINRRIVFAMRLLGVGYEGIKKFCGIMDFPRIFAKTVYDEIVEKIDCASKSVASILFSEAADEEKQLTAEAENTSEPAGLTVSGDGTWHKRSFSSLQGIVTLIGLHSAKVLDVLVKSAYCKECEYWGNKYDTEKFETWMKSHKDTCSTNYTGSSGKMEVDGMIEMFARSEELHGIKYLSYIGDSDCETYKGIVESQPYSDHIEINKKECIDHVQKRMGARLRKLKDTKRLGGKGKLTAKLVDELTNYYGLAIRRHKNSTEDMKTAIWAPLKHKTSTDAKPQHENCPPGINSWCSWQVAKMRNQLKGYSHKPALHRDVIKAITPIYEEFSRDDLLERCLGGYTQNSNESLNGMIWSIAPKKTYIGTQIINIAVHIASSIFNAGYSSLLLIMNTMDITIGPSAIAICQEINRERVLTTKKRTFDALGEGRFARRRSQNETDDQEDPYYEAGMED